MAHGVLHLLGFKDKSEREAAEMRSQEDAALDLFHVEHSK
jgi:ssRNA-specific RNase YbeY (16S rRNA maturation enzyme)